jgi:hypothetical protein
MWETMWDALFMSMLHMSRGRDESWVEFGLHAGAVEFFHGSRHGAGHVCHWALDCGARNGWN